MHAKRTSGSEVHSPKRCTRLIFQLRGCSFHFLFPLWIHFLFFSLPGTSGTVHRRERRSFYCLQLYKLSQRQLVLRNSRYWLSLALLGQISILNHIISSLSNCNRIQQTTYTSFSRTGEGKRRELVTVNLPLYNIHFQITGDPCNLSGSHRCC